MGLPALPESRRTSKADYQSWRLAKGRLGGSPRLREAPPREQKRPPATRGASQVPYEAG